jgi:hypothetical protein
MISWTVQQGEVGACISFTPGRAIVQVTDLGSNEAKAVLNQTDVQHLIDRLTAVRNALLAQEER